MHFFFKFEALYKRWFVFVAVHLCFSFSLRRQRHGKCPSVRTNGKILARCPIAIPATASYSYNGNNLNDDKENVIKMSDEITNDNDNNNGSDNESITDYMIVYSVQRCMQCVYGAARGQHALHITGSIVTFME